MKKTIIFLLLISILFLTSCALPYRMKYPDEYTGQYCHNNYFVTSSNLKYLSCAKNRIDSWKENMKTMQFYGIKDIPLDKYLAVRISEFMTYPYFAVVQSNESQDRALFDYTACKAEIFLGSNPNIDWDKDINRCNWGEKSHSKSIAEISPEYIQKYICNAISEGTYISYDSYDALFFRSVKQQIYVSIDVCIRLYFSEYNNLVWDSNIFQFDNKYYILCEERFENKEDSNEPNTVQEYIYKPVYIELPEDISRIIAEIDTD